MVTLDIYPVSASRQGFMLSISASGSMSTSGKSGESFGAADCPEKIALNCLFSVCRAPGKQPTLHLPWSFTVIEELVIPRAGS